MHAHDEWILQQLAQKAMTLVQIEQTKNAVSQQVLVIAQQNPAAAAQAAQLAAETKGKLDHLADEILQEYIEIQQWQGLTKKQALEALEMQKQQALQAQLRKQQEEEIKQLLEQEEEEGEPLPQFLPAEGGGVYI